MPTQRKFWKDIGPTSEDGETLPRFLPKPVAHDATLGGPDNHYKGLGHKAKHGTLISSVVVSPARTSAMREGEQDLTESEAACFLKPFAWFDNSDPKSCCWRTWQRSFLEGWTAFAESWPRSGIVRNGIAYQLPPLVPRISGTGPSSSRIPTPRAQARVSSKRTKGEYRYNLEEYVNLWPTPAASAIEPSVQRLQKLVDGVTTRNVESGGPPRNLTEEVQLQEQGLERSSGVGQVAAPTGQLNPQWVEWLMGFPDGWTDLDA